MYQAMSENNGHGASPPRKLERRRDGRMLAGVCAGLAAYFGIDVTLVRLGFAVFTIFWGLGDDHSRYLDSVEATECDVVTTGLKETIQHILTFARRAGRPAGVKQVAAP